MVNLGASVLWRARNTPDRLALAFEEQRLSYGALAERFGRLAGMLAARGILPGDRVAVVMKNSPAFLELAFAVSHLGAVFLPINFRLSADEVAHIVGDADASLVIVDEELAGSAGSLADVLVLDGAAQRDSGLVAGDAAIPPPAPRTPDDLYRLMYTSGTTDRPKGVMHSYANMRWKAADHIAALGLSAGERLLIVGPLYHVGAFDLPGLAVLDMGGTIVLQRDFDPVAVARAIEAHRITGIWMAPVMMNAVIDASEAARFDLSSLKWCVAGGERSVEGKIRRFGAVFPMRASSTPMVSPKAAAVTRSCRRATSSRRSDRSVAPSPMSRSTSATRTARCCRPARRRDLPERAEGDKGYWRNPEKTRASFHGDWFCTGDIGVLDDEGFLTINRPRQGHDHQWRRKHRLIRGRARLPRARRASPSSR